MSVLEIIPTKRDAVVFHLKCTNDKVMEYFKQKIDENTGPEDYKTNVQGKMTEYAFFLKDPISGISNGEVPSRGDKDYRCLGQQIRKRR